MAEERDDDIELESMTDGGSIDHDLDYDMEYLLRRRNRGSLQIKRGRLDEAKFERDFFPKKPEPFKARIHKLMLPPEPVKSALTPPLTRKQWFQFLLTHMPILGWVWSYRLKFISGDIISGITVAIMHIPQGLAYALLADLPPVYGLYASFMPTIIYSIFGTSRHISVGTFAVVELMIADAINRVLTEQNLEFCIGISDDNQNGGGGGGGGNGSNVTVDMVTECEQIKVDIAITLAFTTGILMVLMGLFQLGFITIFLSEPLVSGYTTGAACHVFTSQLRHITGIDTNVSPGLWRVPKTWIATIIHLPSINIATLIISIVAIFLLIVMRLINNRVLSTLKVSIPYYSIRLKRRMKKTIKWPVPIPAQLIVVILGAIVAYAAQLDKEFSVKLVGEIPIGAPPISAPSTKYLGSTIQDAFVIAIVTFSVTISLAQVFAKKLNYPIHSNQEFVAYGAMNVIGSFFSSFPAAGSLSRSLIQANTGGKTQLVGFISSLLILITLVAVGPLFEPLPRAVLAAIIWVALYGMFTQVLDVWKYFKLSFPDMLSWLVVFLATALLGVDIGLGVGISFALFILILRTILPYSSVLGQAKNTEIFRNMDNYEKIDRIPGVLIYRFQAPLCFINCKVFRSRLEMATRLDKTGMNGDDEPGCLQAAFRNLRRKGVSDKYEVNNHYLANPDPESGNTLVTEDHSSLSGPGISASGAYQTTDNMTRTFSFQQAVAEDIASAKNLDIPLERIHTVVVDCGPIGFMDSMGVKTILQTVLDFDLCGVQVILAALTKENRDILTRSGFMDRCGKEWLFPSIQDAVHHAKFAHRLHPGDEDRPAVLQEVPREREQPEVESSFDHSAHTATPERRGVTGHSSDDNVDMEMLDSSHIDHPND